MVRKVKGGSSARPRLKKEAMPASVTATMMKTMNERCLSAQSERLRPLTKSLRGAAPSGPDAAPGRRPSPRRRQARGPDEMTAVAGSKRCNLDIAQRDGQTLRIDDPDGRLGVRSRSARWPESRCPAPPSSCMRPVTVAPSRIASGWIDEAEPHLECARDRIGLRSDRAARAPSRSPRDRRRARW